MKANTTGHFEGGESAAKREPHPKDYGCRRARELGYYGKCVDCIIKPCLEDVKGGMQRVKKDNRNREINKLYDAGKTTKEISKQFNITIRTVQRAANNVNITPF